MKTLVNPQLKSKIINFDSSFYQTKEKLINSKIYIDFKFYQKLFLILLTSSTFLIFPESPKDSEALCKKYNSQEACIIW